MCNFGIYRPNRDFCKIHRNSISELPWTQLLLFQPSNDYQTIIGNCRDATSNSFWLERLTLYKISMHSISRLSLIAWLILLYHIQRFFIWIHWSSIANQPLVFLQLFSTRKELTFLRRECFQLIWCSVSLVRSAVDEDFNAQFYCYVETNSVALVSSRNGYNFDSTFDQ